jgi:hypothetical protein
VRRQPLAWTAVGLGVVAVVAAVLSREGLSPDPRFTTPPALAAVVCAALSLVRRERAHAAVLVGACLALAAVLIGWVFLVGIVVFATAGIVLVVSTVM